MTGILLALSLWGSVFAVCRLGKIRFWFAPVVAISGIGLFLFAGALTGKLPLFADLALAAGLAGSGYFAGFIKIGRFGNAVLLKDRKSVSVPERGQYSTAGS